jgi:snoRNA binding domain-containing protein (fibrillarin)
VPEALVRSGRWLRWVDSDGRIVDERPVGASPEQVAELLSDDLGGVPPALLDWIRDRASGATIDVSDPAIGALLADRGIASQLAAPAERRRLRLAAFRPDREDRAILLAVAHRRLEHAMQAPEASLVALAREEERFQRVLRRETNAADSWVSEGASVLSDYARTSSTTRDQLARHLRELTGSLEAQARKVAPNLSAVVGPVVAAHLITAAGGLGPLSRMDSSRIQLLGARRRFGPGRTPRYGWMYHTEGMSQVPADRTGAFARSTAALAAIAARADAGSRRSISDELLRRRDRRIAQLRGRAA